MRIEKGDLTYKDLGYSKYMKKEISPQKPLDIETIRHMLQVGSLTDFITLTKILLGAGIDSEKALQVTNSNGKQIFKVDTLNGWVNIGEDQPLYDRDPQTSLYIVRDIDGYHSINLMNISDGEFASADIGAVNNNPDPSGGYVDLGINGIGWNDPDYAVFDAEAGYTFCVDNNFYVGAGGVGKSIYFFTDGFDSKEYIRGSIDSSGAKFGDITNGNYTKIHTDGTLEFIGDATVWDDIRVTPGGFDRPGISDPTLIAYDVGGGGLASYVYEFDKNNIASFTVQMPHGYKEGESIYAHIHWTPGSRGVAENGNYVGWKIDYSWASINGTFTAMQTVDLSDVCDGTNHKHQMTPEAEIPGTGKTMSSMLICNIKRTDLGTDDTWVSGSSGQQPILLEVDFHYPIDTVGSTEIHDKIVSSSVSPSVSPPQSISPSVSKSKSPSRSPSVSPSTSPSTSVSGSPSVSPSSSPSVSPSVSV